MRVYPSNGWTELQPHSATLPDCISQVEDRMQVYGIEMVLDQVVVVDVLSMDLGQCNESPRQCKPLSLLCMH